MSLEQISQYRHLARASQSGRLLLRLLLLMLVITKPLRSGLSSAPTQTDIFQESDSTKPQQTPALIWDISGRAAERCLRPQPSRMKVALDGSRSSSTVPVAIVANTTYVASYFAPGGDYSADSSYFVNSGVDTSPLHALANGVDGSNGVFLYGASGGFPINSFNSGNYWVDVIYVGSYNVTGTISGTGGTGVTVTLGGAASATTTTDASGNYSFSGLANGSYTVTPSNTGFVFAPTTQGITVAGSNVTVPTFTATVRTFTITGTISGAGGNGATVSLSGGATATTTANASGAYTFSGVTNGAYTVTPTKAGFVYTPASQTVTVSGANATANFSSAAQVFTITGTISGAGGNGATVSLSGGATATTTANASGVYTFSGVTNGSYTVTPSKAGFVYSPVSQAVTVNGANATVNFSSVPIFTITGTISGAGGSGATVNLTGAATATLLRTPLASIASPGVKNGSYTVTPY